MTFVEARCLRKRRHASCGKRGEMLNSTRFWDFIEGDSVLTLFLDFHPKNGNYGVLRRAQHAKLTLPWYVHRQTQINTDRHISVRPCMKMEANSTTYQTHQMFRALCVSCIQVFCDV